MTDPATVDTAGLSTQQLRERITHWRRQVDTATTEEGRAYAWAMRDAYFDEIRERHRAERLARNERTAREKGIIR